MSYEKLVLCFDNEASRIFKYLNLGVPDTLHKLKNKPSKSTLIHSKKLITKQKQLDQWKIDLGQNQIDRILYVVKQIGVDVYSEAIEPDYDKLYKQYNLP